MIRIGFIVLSAFVFTADNIVAAATNSVAIEKLVIFADSDHVRIETTLKTGIARTIQLRGAIAHAITGKQLWEGSLGEVALPKTVTPNAVPSAGAVTTFTTTVSNLTPELWSPGSPTLYHLTITANQGGSVLAQEKIRFGFRSFTSRDGQFILNGRPIFLRGLAINPPGRGIPTATGESRAFAEAYVRFLKSQNVNTIRLTYDSQVWFDICDELGMIVYQGQYGSPLGGLPR